jgi:AcrR family transcriptional regulator
MGTKRKLDTQAILNAAAELAEEKRLENVTLLQVADKLGVKAPSLYNHLNGLRDLSVGVARMAAARLEEAIRDAAVGRSKGDALTAMSMAYRKYAKENPELYKAILRFRDYRDDAVLETGRTAYRILYQVIESYQLGDEETHHAVRAFHSALHGFISLEAAGFFQNPKISADESYQWLVAMLIASLDAKGSD